MNNIVELQTNERELIRVRFHWISLARDGGAVFLLCLGPLLMYPIFASDFFLLVAKDYATLVPVMGFLWVLTAWIAISAIWTNYLFSRLIVTDSRIVHVNQSALLSRDARTWRLDRVEEVSVDKHGFLQMTLNFGSVIIRTAGSRTADVVTNVPDPEHVRSAILSNVASIASLTATNVSQEKLLHTISHEVKAHLTKDAAALASIVEGDYQTSPEQLKKMAGDALFETRKGVNMVMDLLKGSDFKAGTVTFEKRTFDMRETLTDVLVELKPDIERKNLSLQYFASDEPYTVLGDEEKIRDHVIRNLIDNAIHYTPQGSIRVVLARVEKLVVLTVADTGVGLSESDIERLFTEGGKGNESTAVNPSSTGYGLSIAKSVVEAHGGSIWARSSGPGKGSEFYVGIPAA